MGVALLGFAQSKKNVSNRKSFIHTFGKVCAKFRGYLKICRHISINDWTIAALRSEYTVHGTVIKLNYTSQFAHTHLSFSLLQTQVNILWLIMKFG